MKVFIAFALVLSSFVASAQSKQVSGRLELRDGRSIVRISVNENENNLNLRIKLLEEAVRDLQAQVYDLRDSRQVEKINICVLKTNFDGSFIGRAPTQIEAEAIARNNCTKVNASFCSSTPVKCEVQDI